MPKRFKIAIAGVGGVGGFYGAKLALKYYTSNEVTIHFVARGDHLDVIKRIGLKLITDAGVIVAHPGTISDNPDSLGKLDLILFCCKTYDLENFAESFSSNISEETFLVPLSNGVDNTQKLARRYPKAKSLYACTYLISRLESPGIVKMNGILNQLLLGNPSLPTGELEKIMILFTDANIQASLHDDIQLKVWEKYSFVSPLALITTAYDCPIGKILESKEHKAALVELMHELLNVSRREGIDLPHKTIEKNLEKMSNLPIGATSSMQVDFMAGRQMEMETLVKFVIDKANIHGINVPTYRMLCDILETKII